jgi:predicted lysophospholipase L1 biosynthesis ABC-type transport system permease subunit
MKEQDYIRDLAEIRSMMERSSKFLSLSGLAGVMAGIYALAGTWIVYSVYQFNPHQIVYRTTSSGGLFPYLPQVIIVALTVLVLAVGTAILLSWKKANKRDEKVWNATSRRMIANMMVPLVAGGILIVILLSKGLIGLVIPLTLLFYGLALYSASKFTYKDVKFLGLIQMGLGLISAGFIAYSLFLWAFGFGIVHIIYGLYMYFRYER